MKVDLILGGHLHRAYVANSLDAFPQQDGRPGIVIAHSGTTTSRRGRARERNKNSFNLIGVNREQIVITQHVVEGGGEAFLPVARHTFPRRSSSHLPTPTPRDVPSREGGGDSGTRNEP